VRFLSGDIGVVTAHDGSDKLCFKVKAPKGHEWWYKAKEVKLHDDRPDFSCDMPANYGMRDFDLPVALGSGNVPFPMAPNQQALQMQQLGQVKRF